MLSGAHSDSPPLEVSRTVHVLVLSCGSLGIEVASALAPIAGVSRVTLVTAPYRAHRAPRTLTEKVRHVYRTQGLPGLVGVLGDRLSRRRLQGDERPVARVPDGITHLSVSDFHAPEAVSALRAAAPDLGVIAGTYILRESVFGIPAQGCINLHSGKVPEYRGAAPAFWELYNGEREVGITIHRVVAAVDAGAVLATATVPLDPAPPGDPMAYIDDFRETVLRPAGVRLLVDTVAAVAAGTVSERPQPTANAKTYRTPEYRHVRELRRRVRQRRRGGEGSDAA